MSKNSITSFLQRMFLHKKERNFASSDTIAPNQKNPRAILSLFIIGFGLQHDITSLETLIKEACNTLIVQEHILPHHSRELSYQVGLNIKKAWNIDNILLKDSDIYRYIQKNGKQSQTNNHKQTIQAPRKTKYK